MESKIKIMIVSYYELKESLESAAKSLEKQNNKVTHYPLLKKIKELGDNDKLVEDMNKEIEIKKPNIILWWYFNLKTENMKKIIENNKNVYNILFNWDEPYIWNINDIENKAKLIDCAFISCEETIEKWKKYGTKEVYCLYPGYDPGKHYPILIDDENKKGEYECDISICLTNLYENNDIYPEQYINRMKLVNKIYNNQKKYGYKMNIYGPINLEKIYPKSYKKFANYEETNLIYNYSKINISTHVQCNKKGYLNERVFLILGSGGLLFVDKIKGMEKVLNNNQNCVIIEKNNEIEQIKNILDNYEDQEIKKYNGHQTSKKYTWNKWGEEIQKKFINKIKKNDNK